MSAPPEIPFPNPYVGPRSFQRGQKLYGRDEDLRRFSNMLLANRLVLLHAPSGAGKTSLIQAMLLPLMEEQEGFLLLHPEMGARMNFTEIQPEWLRQNPSANPYRLSLVVTLEQGLGGSPRPTELLASMSIQQYLDDRFLQIQTQFPERADAPILLIIDQFEEILTHEPHNLTAKAEFFDELAGVLRNKRLWVVLSMRDDYLGPMEPYLAKLPGGFNTRFRLDLLDETHSIEAIRNPAKSVGVDFSIEAAKELFANLCQITALKFDGTIETMRGVYVEPVQLQVVCYNLWEIKKPTPDRPIQVQDVSQPGFVDTILGNYYAEKVLETALDQSRKELNLPGSVPIARAEELKKRTLDNERKIRNWMERHLITGQKIRSQVMLSIPKTPPLETGIPNDSIWMLTRSLLVRAESRRGLTFFELSHDRLVQPILDNNDDWRQARAEFFNQKGQAWLASGAPFLEKRDLEEALDWRQELENNLNEPAKKLIQASLAYQDLQAERLRPPTISLVERGVNLEDRGWGVIFADNLDPAVRFALSPLLEHRYLAATRKNPAYYKEFRFERSTTATADSAQTFLTIKGVGAGAIDPAKVPYYLLLVGSPQDIPFEFQYGLGVQYAVGRIFFDTPQEYWSYARSVVAVEKETIEIPRKLGLGSLQNIDDPASLMITSNLVEPLNKDLLRLLPDWVLDPYQQTGGSTLDPQPLLNKPDAPGIVFLAGSAPDSPGEPEPTQDSWDSARLLGMAVILFGSYTAGASGANDYAHRQGVQYAYLAYQDSANLISTFIPPPAAPFLARLPQRLLGHPGGGALTVFAHVERASSFAFPQEIPPEDHNLFLDLLRRLAAGYTAGQVKEILDDRYVLYLSSLGQRLSRAASQDPALEARIPSSDPLMSSLLTQTVDARNYVLLGDPAAYLPPERLVSTSPETISSTLPSSFAQPESVQVFTPEKNRQLPSLPYLFISNPNGVNLRLGPDLSATIQGIAPSGCILQVSASTASQEWFQVRYFDPSLNPAYAWIKSAPYLTTFDTNKVEVLNLAEQVPVKKTVETPIPAPLGISRSESIDLEILFAAVASEGAGPIEQYSVEMNLSLPGREAVLRLPTTTIDLDIPGLLAQEQEAQSQAAALSSVLWSKPALLNNLQQVFSAKSSLGVPLRARFVIPPELPELNRLPWENLLDPSNSPLVLTSEVFLSRYLWSASWRPVPLRPQPQQLKVIAFLLSPSAIATHPPNIIPAALSLEHKNTLKRLSQLTTTENIKITTTQPEDQPGSLDTLVRHLSEGCDVLYLAGHFLYPKDEPYPHIVLEDQSHQVQNIPVSHLVERLQALPLEIRPQLLILSPFETPDQPQMDSSAGARQAAAPFFAQAGIPAILTFRDRILTETFDLFLQTFFTELKLFGLVDRAVAVARQKIQAQPDFGYPLLYSRLKNGALWYISPTSPGDQSELPLTQFIFNVPSPSPDLVERPKLLNKLLDELLDLEHRSRPAALLGLPGSGKSDLVIKACHSPRIKPIAAPDEQTAYKDGVLWATLGTNPDFQSILSAWISTMTGQSRPFTSLSEAQSAFQEAIKERQYLIILDDVEDRTHLDPFLTGGAGCKRLITSNNRAVLPPNSWQLVVSSMEKDEALVLLGRDFADQYLEVLLPLAETLGYWPLALYQANQLLKLYNRPGRPLSEAAYYLENEIETRGLAALDLPTKTTERAPSIVRSMAGILADLSPEDRERLEIFAAFLVDELIPFEALRRIWAYSGNLDDRGVLELLERYEDRGLLERKGTNKSDAMVHSLLHRYLRENTIRPIVEYHNLVLAAYGVERWSQWAPDEPYIWSHACYHLASAARTDFLSELLLNLRWIQFRIQNQGISQLLEDYEQITTNPTLDRLQSALRLSADILEKHPDQLSSQLLGRLLGFTNLDLHLRSLLQAASMEIGPLQPLNAGLTAPGGAMLATMAANPFVRISTDNLFAVLSAEDNGLLIWDLNRGKISLRIPGINKIVQSFELFQDIQRPMAVVAYQDHSLSAWDLLRGVQIASPSPPGRRGRKRNVIISKLAPALLALSQETQKLVSLSAEGELDVWHLPDFKHEQHIGGLAGEITTLQAGPGDTLYYGTQSGEVHQISFGGDPSFQKRNWQAHHSAVRQLAATADGEVFSLAEDGEIQILNETGAIPYSGYAPSASPVTALAFAERASLFITGHANGELLVWQKGSSQPAVSLPAHTTTLRSLALSPDGGRAISIDQDGHARFWDLTRASASASTASYPQRAVGFVPDKDHMIALDSYGLLEVWDRRAINTSLLNGLSPEISPRTLTPPPSMVSYPQQAPLPETKYIAAAIVAPNHLFLLEANGAVVVWDLDQGNSIQIPRQASFEQQVIIGVRQIPGIPGLQVLSIPAVNERQLQSKMSQESPSAEMQVWGYSFEAADPNGITIQYIDHELLLRQLLFFQDWRTLQEQIRHITSWLDFIPAGIQAFGTASGFIHFWNSGNEETERRWNAHLGTVYGLAGTPDGRLLISCGHDQTLRVWNGKTAEQQAIFYADNPLFTCAISADGRFILAGDAAGNLHIFNYTPVETATPIQELSFIPAQRFTWQNPALRSQIYPSRDEKLREFLLIDRESELVHNLGGKSDTRRISIELSRYSAELKGHTHDRLIDQLVNLFNRQPERYPEWARYLLLHFSGIRTGSAHGAWADPFDLVTLLEEFTTKRLEGTDFRQTAIQELDQSLQDQIQLTPDSLRLKRLKSQRQALQTPASQLETVQNYLTAQEIGSTERNSERQVLTRLLRMKSRLKFPAWFWREVTRLTNLRLAIASGDWLNDWENLTLQEFSDRRQQEYSEWIAIFHKWTSQPAGWRASHFEQLSPLVTRLFSNDLADHAYHLRGISPEYGMANRIEWLYNSSHEPGYVFYQPATVADLLTGASIFSLGWVNNTPYPWESTRPLVGLDFLQVNRLISEDPGWSYYTVEDKIMRRLRKAPIKYSKSQAASQETVQWLAWVTEKIILGVVDLLDGPTLLTFEITSATGSANGIQRTPLTAALNQWSDWLGYAPGRDLAPVARQGLSASLRPASLRLRTQSRRRSRLNWTELHPEQTYPAHGVRLSRYLEKLGLRERQILAMISSGADPYQAAKLIGLTQPELETAIEQIEEIFGAQNIRELTELFFNWDFGNLQARSSP